MFKIAVSITVMTVFVAPQALAASEAHTIVGAGTSRGTTLWSDWVPRQSYSMSLLQDTPDGYTWHHHQDCLTLQLVPWDLHSAVYHTGGVAMLKSCL